jgi:hypothetical protein
MFELTGERLFPCGLKIRFYREGAEETPSQQYDVTVIDETTVKVTLSNSLFQEKGNYFVFFMYGPDFKFTTNSILLVEDNSTLIIDEDDDDGGTPDEGSVSNQAGIIIGVVIAVVAVCAVTVIIIIVLIWRHQINKRLTEESRNEKTMEDFKNGPVAGNVPLKTSDSQNPARQTRGRDKPNSSKSSSSNEDKYDFSDELF